MSSAVLARNSIDRLVRGATDRRYSSLVIGVSFGGFAFVVLQLFLGSQMGIFPIPGQDELIWDRVGDALWTGAPVYYNAPRLNDSFVYAPPLAVVFASISWLPIEAQHLLFFILKVASLRIIAGSWIGAGLACWFPLVAFDLGGGNFNLLVAAAIVTAVIRRPEAAVWAGLAKFGPLLAIHPRAWRRAAIALLFAVGITLPWLHLWPEWLGLLAADAGRTAELGSQVPIPWALRLAAAVALLALVRTPWARALAATLAIPAFYWASMVLLVAPLATFVRERLARENLRGVAVSMARPQLEAGRP